ncbi:MAG TPA: SAM-dependent methyltransferase [Actinomycetota bacterium]|nr:SAM-dependent methyltransferase [Actinomycetota bacterium]
MGHPLMDRLLARIAEGGPMTFAEYMEAALYDPEEGFYARPPVGENGHYATSPHVSPAFGALLGRQVAQVWDVLGRPERLDVVEIGAGDGTLAAQILEATAAVPELGSAIRYVGVERSAGARAALERRGLQAAASLGAVRGVRGCILANEVLDNAPFHRLRERDGTVVEVLVGADDGRLVEVEGKPTDRAVEALAGRSLRPGEERPVSPAGLRLVRQIAEGLERGYALVFDYGFGAGERPGPVHGYRDQRVTADVLEEPGSRDITAAVDLESIAAEARASGLRVWGPVTQREALLGLGFRTWMQGLRSRQTQAQLTPGGWREAGRLYSERNRASILVDPDKLGSLRLLAFGTDGLPPPAAALGDRETGC